DITPPPCLWIPQGDAHAGSQVVIDFYNNTDPGPGALFDGQHAFQEAKQLVTQIPPQTLAQLALAKMNVPQAGRMILSPRSGNSYSNLPTFSRVTLSFRPEFGPGGLPYVTDNAQLGDQGATVWVEATPLQLSTNDNAARLETAGCGYLGSTEMVRNSGAVAR